MDHEATPAQGPDGHLSIGDLAQETGLSPAVLRMWETRHGFPEPQRLESGHRRYSAADVERVRHVLRRKDAGVRLEIAIAEVQQASPPRSPSIFAEVRRRHPSLAVNRLRKTTLIALSHAIEDEACATAERPVLFGAFQRGDFYEPSAQRWIELDRVARSAIVFADRWDEDASSADGPVRSTLDPRAPMRREWAVVCDAPDAPAVLSAWELPGQASVPDRDRVFEAVWSVDPVVVRDAARVAAAVAAEAGVLAAQPLVRELADPPSPAAGRANATALFNRVLAYVDGLR